MLTWPNSVTFLRLLLIPGVVLCYLSPLSRAEEWAAALFVIASVSDLVDGYLARKFDQVTDFGAFLDPVADKLLVSTTLVMLVSDYPILLAASAVIIAREILVSALREWMAGGGLRDVVAVAFIGKLKTAVQMAAIVLLILAAPGSGLAWMFPLGVLLIHLAALLSIASMLEYFRRAWPALMGKR